MSDWETEESEDRHRPTHGKSRIRKERSRSRSPRNHSSNSNDTTSSSASSSSSNSRDGDSTSQPPPPPATIRPQEEKKPENIALGAKNRLKSISIQMKLGAMRQSPKNKPKLTVASAFNQESDEEPEQMPPEAKMRMRNIGRDTPTSSGPNSFGKTKHGFSDAKKLFEKNLKEAMESALADD